MPKLAPTKPAPAARPLSSASRSCGSGPSHDANTHAAINANTNAMPKTRPGCCIFSGFSPRPASRFHSLWNSTGEYHSPPSAKLETAATSTAQMLTAVMIALVVGPRPDLQLFLLDRLPRRGARPLVGRYRLDDDSAALARLQRSTGARERLLHQLADVRL